MRPLFFLFFTLLLTGCTLLSPQPISTVTHYTLNAWPEIVSSSQKPTTHKTLLVSMPIASPGYQSSKMIYVQVPYELKSFADHRWVAPPAELLLPLLANRLRAMHYFQAVVTAPFSGTAQYQLNTQLLSLEQEFIRPVSSVRLALEVTLIKTATGEVLANRVFETTESAISNNPYGGVLAANSAAHQLINQISTFVVKYAR